MHLAPDLHALWAKQERWLGRLGLPAPYWGIAWPGGQAIARHVLDEPARFRGLSILDLGSGSGLCAIAAAMAGARDVEAADTDAFAPHVIRANARLNQVHVSTDRTDLIGSPSRWDVVLAGDLWYERFLAQKASAWLRRLAAEGTQVFMGDCGRAFFPRAGLARLPGQEIPVSEDLERASSTLAQVWTFT